MSSTNVLDWSRTGSRLHSIIPEHIRTCTRVSQATCAEYRQKYFTTLALCLQIIPVRRPLVSGGEGPEQWYDFISLSWPNPGLPGKKPQSPGFSVKIWFLHFFGLSGMLPMLCALWIVWLILNKILSTLYCPSRVCDSVLRIKQTAKIFHWKIFGENQHLNRLIKQEQPYKAYSRD